MSKEKILPLAARSKKAMLRQPKQIAYFSRDLNYKVHPDRSNLSYYYLPDGDIDNNIDLSVGSKHFLLGDSVELSKLDPILLALKGIEKESGAKTKDRIITWRGIMRKLLTLPYDSEEDFVLDVVSFDGQLFIQFNVPYLKSKDVQKQGDTEFHKKLQFSGYKFEKMATLPKPWPECTRKEIDNRAKSKCNNIEQYGAIVRTGISRIKILIGGEVDCTADFYDENDPLSRYIELKTTRTINQYKDMVTFEKKLFRTWAQCFLLGIPRIIYGFRDDNCILRTVEEFSTNDVPLMVKNNPLNEQPKKENCYMSSINFYGAVVEWLNESVKDDQVWKLSYSKRNKQYLVLKEVTDENEKQQIVESAIPAWFKEWRSELKNSECNND
ncbi:BA75_00788T0 [Komagataella pastoris]|uniref:Decapping nuclease n=1 Tax=Komagataella pastoris TaxID=4922 RepID=A0A1B2JAD9_PICPA|nr:BA75_00788T0 [Komagataella pastoris]